MNCAWRGCKKPATHEVGIREITSELAEFAPLCKEHRDELHVRMRGMLERFEWDGYLIRRFKPMLKTTPKKLHKCKHCDRTATRNHARHDNGQREDLCEEHYRAWHG